MRLLHGGSVHGCWPTTFYVLFFLQVGSRKVYSAGVTPCPDERWMKQVARNVTMDGWGFLQGQRYLILDRDSKFCAAFRDLIQRAGVKLRRLPPRSPNLNAHAERFVRSLKEECLSRLLLFGEAGLRRALGEYVAHYHAERNHQGKANQLLFPSRWEAPTPAASAGLVGCEQRLGGLLKFYRRRAA